MAGEETYIPKPKGLEEMTGGSLPEGRDEEIRRMVEERPISGGQDVPEDEGKVDISELVKAQVEAAVASVRTELSDQISGLQTKLQVSEAQKEALEKRMEGLEGIEGLKRPLNKILKAIERTAVGAERTAASGQASSERLLIPESERPKTKEGWADLAREELTVLRDRGESPYSPFLWGERPEVKRVLESIPKKDWEGISAKEWEKLQKELEKEIWVIQKEDGLATQWSQRSSNLKALGELTDLISATGVALDPEKLNALSSLAPAKTPEYLKEEGKEIIPEGESMSIQVSRALHIYAKYFGVWAEEIANEMDKPGGIEDRLRTRWLKGDFSKDKKKWGKAVDDEIDAFDYRNNSKLSKAGKEVLERLGFGSDGKIPYKTLQEIFKEMPDEASKERKYQDLKKQIDDAVKAKDTGGLSLAELFDRNIFCQNINVSESRYTQWLVAMLAGSEYAGESAMRFLRYTGESGEMNTTHVPGAWVSDGFTRIPWIERRRLSEARKRRVRGPNITLGRYKFPIEREGKERGLCHSWVREAEVKIGDKKMKIIELLRGDNRWFHEIPWDQLGQETYISNFTLAVTHGVNIFGLLTNPNIELTGREGLLSQAEELKKLNKSMQYSFKDWESGEIALKKEDGTPIDGDGGWEKRENWAQYWLEKVKSIKGLSAFGKSLWSPWFTFYLGAIYEHHPNRNLPQREIHSPTGIYRKRKIPHSRRWNEERETAEGGRIYRENSVADFIGEGVEQEVLTPGEAELLIAVCQISKVKKADILGL
ncbi:MAG TPA: hypothetical protein VMY36_02875 [Patescibacteria group bacterium]|nr:hypothetical protein [Patescibacteria group bacterium]